VQTVKFVLKSILLFPLAVLLGIILYINIKLHYSPKIEPNGSNTINIELLKELRGLKIALSHNADIDMQKLFPEGYVFINSLYSIAWCNFLGQLSKDAPEFQEGVKEVQSAWNKIDSEVGRSRFNEELSIPYGAFYAGWSSYVLGKKLSITTPNYRDTTEVIYFKRTCQSIARAIAERTYPASYYGSAWPADVTICAASLAIHDRIFEPQYRDVLYQWVSEVKLRLDRRSLIPHSADPLNGMALEDARGSSHGLTLIFLREIDSTFANEQFTRYKEIFLDERFGLTGIREYSKKDYGIGDVDSGPVIMGIGSAATIVGMQTLNLFNDVSTGLKIRNEIEVIGFPTDNTTEKIYLLGCLPMTDAFIAWSHSAEKIKKTDSPNFIVFHCYSLIVITLVVIFMIYLWKHGENPHKRSLKIPW
jgi:hypothetical protein